MLSRPRNGSEVLANSGVNLESCCAMPKNLRSSVMFSGVWKWSRASTLVLSGFIPAGDMLCPRKSIVV